METGIVKLKVNSFLTFCAKEGHGTPNAYSKYKSIKHLPYKQIQKQNYLNECTI